MGGEDKGEHNSKEDNIEQTGPLDDEQNRQTPRVYWSATRDRAEQMDLQLRSGAYEVLNGALLRIAPGGSPTGEAAQQVPYVWPEPEAREHVERIATYLPGQPAESQGADEGTGQANQLEIGWWAGVDMQSPDDSTVRLELRFGNAHILSLWFHAGRFRQLLDTAANLRQLAVLAYPPPDQPLNENWSLPGEIPLLSIYLPEEAADSLIDMLSAIYPDV